MNPCHNYITHYNFVAGRDGIPYTEGSCKHVQIRQSPTGDKKWFYCFGFGQDKNNPSPKKKKIVLKPANLTLLDRDC